MKKRLDLKDVSHLERRVQPNLDVVLKNICKFKQNLIIVLVIQKKNKYSKNSLLTQKQIYSKIMMKILKNKMKS